jgi:glutaminase
MTRFYAPGSLLPVAGCWLLAKSGVGGGVVAVMPGKFVAAVWSPIS